ncbi:MAG TPA: DUF3592 domain-containing protein [Thermoanaerobaculia bacterium]|jgi:hypothetical protein|nr:DUF3592 domain-containing protein [Thermoanaerobaculia bacterium]
MSPALGRLLKSLRSAGIAVLVLGAIALWMLYLAPARNAQAARGWQPTDCRIVSTERTLRVAKRHHTKVGLEVVYEYTAKGQTHRNTLYRFGGHVEEPEITQAVSHFRSGTRTTCWVDPANPEQAVLLQGFSPKPADLAFAVSCLVAGALLLAGAWLVSRRITETSPRL